MVLERAMLDGEEEKGVADAIHHLRRVGLVEVSRRGAS